MLNTILHWTRVNEHSVTLHSDTQSNRLRLKLQPLIWFILMLRWIEWMNIFSWTHEPLSRDPSCSEQYLYVSQKLRQVELPLLAEVRELEQEAHRVIGLIQTRQRLNRPHRIQTLQQHMRTTEITSFLLINTFNEQLCCHARIGQKKTSTCSFLKRHN